jgi:hypothetical protein
MGFGKLLKGVGKLARGADEAEEGLSALSRLANVSDELAGASAKLSDVPEAFARNGSRSVRTQPAGKGHCMVDACGMVLDTLGVKVDETIMNKYRKLADAGKGLHVHQGAALLEEHGVKATGLHQFGTKGLEQFTARGGPVIVVQNTNNAAHTLHAVVVDGITTKPTIGKVAAVRNPWGLQYFQKYNRFWADWTFDAVVVLK